jgi:hypothetical protein
MAVAWENTCSSDGLACFFHWCIKQRGRRGYGRYIPFVPLRSTTDFASQRPPLPFASSCPPASLSAPLMPAAVGTSSSASRSFTPTSRSPPPVPSVRWSLNQCVVHQHIVANTTSTETQTVRTLTRSLRCVRCPHQRNHRRCCPPLRLLLPLRRRASCGTQQNTMNVTSMSTTNPSNTVRT